MMNCLVMSPLSTLLRFLVAFLFFYGVNAKALETSECFLESPNLNASDQAYFDLTPSARLTSAQQQTLSETVKRLSGKWHGKLTETNCKGSERAPNKQTRVLAVTADISHNTRNSLRLAVRKTGYRDQLERHETLLLLSQQNLFGFNQQDGRIQTIEKYRLKNANQASRLLETITVVNHSGQQLTLEINYYTNGVFVQGLAYTLVRE